MSNTVNVNLNVSSNGTLDNENKKAEKLKNTLTAAQRAASQTSAVQNSSKDSELNSYGLARGTVGTGAGGRDFAKQAQGLGGLVHLYATFAANLFAVSAAFNALSKAADFENMRKGLDQLGASSGKNLAYMAQNIQKVSDGAISLKDSMEAVAQASSAGMDGSQIAKMAEVAKKASQALGRDMSDALNRLSRGITKIEPELLDELGIFTKVDKAASDYARTIGKTALSLTDYERRQAFATAALKEASDKFNAIELDANPYNKLQASFINLAYSGGELLNKVLSPIANILAQSPMALGAVIAGFAAMLISKAIPAISQWRQGVIDAADAAEKRAISLKENLETFKINQQVGKMEEHRAAAEAYRSQAMSMVEDNGLFGKKSKIYSAIQDPTSDLTKNLPQVQSKITQVESAVKKLKDAQTSGNLATQAEVEQNTAAIAVLEKKKASYVALAAVIRAEAAELQHELDVEHQAASPSWEEQIAQRRANKAQKTAGMKRIGAQAVSDTENFGMAYAFKNIGENISKHNEAVGKGSAQIGALGKAYLYTAGSARILATSAMSIISAFSEAFIIIGALVAVYEVLDSQLTNNSRALEDYTTALDRVKSSAELVDKTLYQISKKDPLSQLSIESVLAKANAFKELGDSMSEAKLNFDRVQDSNSEWTRFWDSTASIFGSGQKDKLNEAFSKTVIGAYKLLESDPELQKQITDILGGLQLSGVESIDKKRLSEALKEGAISQDEFDSITERLKKLGEEGARAFNNIKSSLDTLGQASKDLDNISTGLLPSDSLSKFYIDGAKGFANLSTQLTDSTKKLSIVKSFMSDITMLRLVNPEDAKDLAALDIQLSKMDKEIQLSKDALVEARRKRAPTAMLTQSIKEQEAAKADLISKAADKLSDGMAKNTTIMVDGITKAFDIAASKASLIIQKAAMAGLSAPGAALESAKLSNRDIDLNIKQLDAQYSLIKSQDLLRLQIEELTLIERKKEAKTPEEAGKIEALLTKNTQAQEIVGSKTPRKITAEEAAANPNVVTSFSQQQAMDIKKAEAAAQKRANLIAAQIAGLKEIEAYEKAIAAASDLRLATSEKYNQSVLSGLGIVTKESTEFEKSVILQKQKNQDAEYYLKQADMVKELTIRLNAAGTEDQKNVARKAFMQQAITMSAEHEAASVENIIALRQKDLQFTQYIISLKQKENDLASKLLDIESSIVDAKEESGKITKSASILQKAELEIQKASLAAYSAIATKKAALNDPKLIDSKARDAISNEISLLERSLEFDKAKIKAQAEYQAALLKTEESLRGMEKAGKYTQDYFGTVYQDFTNKVKDLSKNAKSAADTFNSGFINAIDSSIDKFFEMLQTGQLKMKDMMSFLRNSLSNVFRDTASQVMKNAWKDALSGILPESSAEKAQTRLITALDELRLAIEAKSEAASGALDNTSAGGDISQSNLDALNSTDTSSLDSTTIAEEAGKDQKSAAVTQSKAATGFLASVKGMGSAVSDLVTGNITFSQGMDKIVTNFGNLLPSFLTGMQGILIGALGGIVGGGGGGNSFFGTLIKSGIGALVGGVTSGAFSGMFGSSLGTGVGSVTSNAVGIGGQSVSLNQAGATGFGGASVRLPSYVPSAKGNAFSYADGLEPYSNSIVTSPTVFAFARGGIPANKGLMGESGPEAILPLRRDASGNLGVRTDGSGGNLNNIEINITIENGNAMDTGGQKDQSNIAGQLGNAIKVAVSEELIKQSRPGGLLARR